MDDGGNDVMKPIDAAHSVNLTPALSYQRKDGQSAINKVAACAYVYDCVASIYCCRLRLRLLERTKE